MGLPHDMLSWYVKHVASYFKISPYKGKLQPGHDSLYYMSLYAAFHCEKNNLELA